MCALNLCIDDPVNMVLSQKEGTNPPAAQHRPLHGSGKTPRSKLAGQCVLTGKIRLPFGPHPSRESGVMYGLALAGVGVYVTGTILRGMTSGKRSGQEGEGRGHEGGMCSLSEQLACRPRPIIMPSR
jgi:hypothetical protein